MFDCTYFGLDKYKVLLVVVHDFRVLDLLFGQENPLGKCFLVPAPDDLHELHFTFAISPLTESCSYTLDILKKQ